MIPLLTSRQIHDADAYTILHEPIASVELMERAARKFTSYFIGRYTDKAKTISIYCGTGNNGGDGLAIARMLTQHQYHKIKVKIARFTDNSTADFKTNFERLKLLPVSITEIGKNAPLPPEPAEILIDALLGSGLNKPLTGDYERLVNYLNSLQRTVVAVDVPTGFFIDGGILPGAVALRTELTITFQQPRINFLLPESAAFIKSFEVVPIGINESFMKSLNSPFLLVEESDIRKKLHPRQRFSNKGTYGHALLVAGEPETMGAALLCSSACAHAGAGLTTACIPQSGLIALNSYQPEVMAVVRQKNEVPDADWTRFSAIGIGPGLGKTEGVLTLFKRILSQYKNPVVVDADALNMLSIHEELWSLLPEKSILTPHMKEFDRLFGEHQNWWQRLETMRTQAQERKLVILLKNDYTIIATPDGKLYFNSTSNAAMASGGMGDVLTGIITALLAQGYSSADACMIGAYIHGKAGDELALPGRMAVVLPGKLTRQLPFTLARLMA
jgi:NAD(P)H-hydrate epimerase